MKYDSILDVPEETVVLGSALEFWIRDEESVWKFDDEVRVWITYDLAYVDLYGPFYSGLSVLDFFVESTGKR